MKCCNPECEAPLTKKPKVWEVKGWTRSRHGGGLNALKDAKATGRVFCEPCGTYFWTFGRMRPIVPEGQITIEEHLLTL